MKRYLKFLGFLPAIMMMVAVFSFSSSPGTESSNLSDGISYKIVDQVSNLPFITWNESEKIEKAEQLHGPIRKVAHFIEYAILCVLWILPLGFVEETTKKRLILSILICFLYACTDELHQLYVPGRDGNIRDVVLDTVGAVSGSMVWKIARNL